MPLPPRALSFVSSGFAIASSASAQILVVSGDEPGSNFGTAVATGGDIDGDGTPDLVVGAPASDVGGPDSGSVRVFSGASGAQLFAYIGHSPGHQLGFAVAIPGDLDGDGRADFAAGAAGGNYVRIWSGASGGLLRTLFGAQDDDFGATLAPAGDVDLDGAPDLLVGAPGHDGVATDSGLARVYSGRTGDVLLELLGTSANEGYGYALAAAGRVDADPWPDLVVGTSTGSNVVEVRSGADGSLIHVFFGDASIDWFGTAVAGPGDVDGDGRADVLVGASQGLLGPGYARVFSGATGALLHHFAGAASLDLFGWSVSAAGDVDGDGKADVAISAPFADAASGHVNAGVVYVYSGATGALLSTFAGIADDEALGWSISGGPCANLACGAPLANPAGTVRVFDTAQTPGWTSYCVGAPNSVGPGARMSAEGSTSLAQNQFTLIATGAPPNSSGVFFYGHLAVQVAFGNGYRCIGGPTVRLNVLQASPSGVATRAIDFGALPAAGTIRPGDVWRFQLWYRNPAGGGSGYNLSDGLRVLFCL